MYSCYPKIEVIFFLIKKPFGMTLLINFFIRSSHCSLYLQEFDEHGEEITEIGEISCITRFIKMLLGLVSLFCSHYIFAGEN